LTDEYKNRTAEELAEEYESAILQNADIWIHKD